MIRKLTNHILKYLVSSKTTTPATRTPVTLQGNAGYYGAQASGSFTP